VLTPARIEAACGRPLFSRDEPAGPAPRASGTLAAHYAPNARVRLMDAQAIQTALDLLGTDLDGSSARIAVYSRAIVRSRSARVLRRRMPDDAGATAQQLFAVLREFDAQGATLIWVETLPAAADWDGVRDRLQRASAA
jgi:L-threonylcarbamoyladenylate synthase